MYYDQLVSDKEAMKVISMNKRRQAQMLGILFAEYQILTTEQASMIRNQMDRPSHVFEDSNSLWAFYNYVTTALQHSHPKTWMEDQRVLHYFISTVNNFSTAPIPQPVVEAPVDPLTANYGQPENQLNLLTEIEKAEAEETSLETEPSITNLEINDFKIENNLNDSDVEETANEVIEETITYTDPVGNTFEAPIVSIPEVVSITPTPEDHELFDAEIYNEESNADLDSLKSEEIPLELPKEELDDDFDFNFASGDEEDEDLPDFF
jgi:hypothetical protein